MVDVGNSLDQNPLFPYLYTFLLRVVLYLTEEVNSTRFPIFFEDSHMVELLLIEITQNRKL